MKYCQAGTVDGMKVSEKSLELNVGAELLALLRGPWKMPKAYLRGLTQREEHQEGVDFFAQQTPTTRIFAFQFKAPKGPHEGEPYRFTIQRQQHEKLSELAGDSVGNVFYVLPFYISPAKLQDDVPDLLTDTWFLPVAAINGAHLFGTYRTRTMRCERGMACINPEYELRRAGDLEPGDGIPVQRFADWYADLHGQNKNAIDRRKRKDPSLVRGLQFAIVQTPTNMEGVSRQREWDIGGVKPRDS